MTANMREQTIVSEILPEIKFSAANEQAIINRAEKFISIIRDNRQFGIEEFMQHYSLSTEEGIAVMSLAESLLRIPDNQTILELSEDKLAGKNWAKYIDRSSSLKFNMAAIGLSASGRFADSIKLNNILANTISKLGTPAFLLVIKQAVKFLSKEFILGNDISSALKATREFADYRFAFDLLGESARTSRQAKLYYDQYLEAIDLISRAFPDKGESIYDRPNLSVKLTALYPRFELTKLQDIEKALIPKLVVLINKIKENNLTISFDAEEAKRLDLYLYVLEKIITHKDLKGFSGVGFVVQAYQTRAHKVVDKIISLAKVTKKRIPVRLVKGAYWDSEIKFAQEQGLKEYPVFTRKEYTDCNYIYCAKKILSNSEYIFPQFATHNALTAATIIELADDREFEFQKLHGMGKALHNELVKKHKVRIYAPIGKMEDLLAYLMRRMLENGANTSFVNQVKNKNFEVSSLAYSLYEKVRELYAKDNNFTLPQNIYLDRENSMGYDLGYKTDNEHIREKVASYYDKVYTIGSIINGKEIIAQKNNIEHFRPAKLAEKIAEISVVTESEMLQAVEAAHKEFEIWSMLPANNRAEIARKVAQVYEENKFELYSLIIREAGKTIQDAIGEVREAIDFCRYYANQAEVHCQPKKMPGVTGESNVLTMHGRGVFLCISPWNFPLAIFTGQIIAALVSGNTVIAKPADQTSIIANVAIKLMHKAGIPTSALHLLIAPGSSIGQYVVKDERIAGVVFTGSTTTAKTINLSLAERQGMIVPFIAETGGQNAMIVDSSALLEQVTDDVLISSFYTAGQRCSALRILYVQEEIYDALVSMIKEAIELLKIGDTIDFANDIGPVINKAAQEMLTMHIEDMSAKGFNVVAHQQKGQLHDGYYFYPHIIEVKSINDIPDERFGPILHIAKYKTSELDEVLDDINNYGFGLTFGIHSRLEKKIEYIKSRVKVGNIYANRSIIGAQVESQPFGGENKSGTGFKAGGPHYLLKFMTERTTTINLTAIGGNIELLKSA